MSIPAGLETLAGRWQGRNLLWLSEQPLESETTAAVRSVAGGACLCIEYVWSYEGAAQEGILLIGSQGEGGVQGVWRDSWHSAGEFLLSEGAAEGDGDVSLLGQYAAPPGPPWGWQTRLRAEGEDRFEIVMINISPDGEQTPGGSDGIPASGILCRLGGVKAGIVSQLTFATVDAEFPDLPGDGLESAQDGPFFVRRLLLSSTQADRCIDTPNWKQIERAVRALNGTDDIMLVGPGPYPSFPYLVVCGRDDRYLVTVGQEKNTFVLANPEPPDLSEFTVFLGGQPSARPAEHAVDIQSALTAGHAFARQGTLTYSLRPLCWVKDF